jgi:hypothetical protein
MTNYRVDWLQLSRCLNAADAVCPECRVLDLNTDFNTGREPWELTCSRGHRWELMPTPEMRGPAAAAVDGDDDEGD